MIGLPPKNKIVKLNTDEISELIQMLYRESHEIFLFMKYDKIVTKLEEATDDILM
jgi:hypothetical protein